VIAAETSRLTRIWRPIGNTLQQSVADADLFLTRLRRFLDAVDAGRLLTEGKGDIIFNIGAPDASGNRVAGLVAAQLAPHVAGHLAPVEAIQDIAFVKAGARRLALRFEVGDDGGPRGIAGYAKTKSRAFLPALPQ